MESYKLFILCLFLGFWRCPAAGRVIGSHGHDAILSGLQLHEDAIRQYCVDRSYTNVTCSDVGEDGLLPHPEDCRLFYYCVAGLPICRQCPAELHFNPAIHVCDRPEDAGCELRAATANSTSPETIATEPETRPTTRVTSPPTATATNPGTPSTITSTQHSTNDSVTDHITSTSPEPSSSTTRAPLTTYIPLQ